MLTDESLTHLLRARESPRVERKEAYQSDDVKKTVCAFANDISDSQEPGIVFIGIRDDGSCANLTITDALLLRVGEIRADGNLLPAPAIEIEERVLNGCRILVLQVRPHSAPPVRFKGRAFIRVGPRNQQASPEKERILNERRRGRDLPFDGRPIDDAVLNDIDESRFRERYLRAAIDPSVVAQNGRSDVERMISLRLLDPNGAPTFGGLLIVGKDPERFIPGAYIQYNRFEGSDLTSPIVDTKRISGTLDEQLSALEDILKLSIKTEIDISEDGAELRTSDYPFAALQQLARNAVMHRNYESNAPIRVYWFADRVEIHNAGGLFGQVNVANFGTGVTDYRNPLVSRRDANLRVCAEVRHWDSVGPKGSSKQWESEPRVSVRRCFDRGSHQEIALKSSIAFFNNKDGVGKTSFVYHLACMYADLGLRVLAVDLDPQANLSSMFLTEERLEEVLRDDTSALTVLGCVKPILEGTGDIAEPHVEDVETPNGYVGLVIGDLGLSKFEDKLSESWPKTLGADVAAMRAISAFSRIITLAGQSYEADVALIDVGPNLGALNRAALIAADYVVIPLAPDLFSLQGLRNLGPTLNLWRSGWKKRLDENKDTPFRLPRGRMRPAGYVVLQHAMRLDRPVHAYSRWMSRIPEWYRKYLKPDGPASSDLLKDPECLALLKNYRSLMPLAQEARKPMFALKVADGALGAQQYAVADCYDDFHKLAVRISSACSLRSGALAS